MELFYELIQPLSPNLNPTEHFCYKINPRPQGRQPSRETHRNCTRGNQGTGRQVPVRSQTIWPLPYTRDVQLFFSPTASILAIESIEVFTVSKKINPVDLSIQKAGLMFPIMAPIICFCLNCSVYEYEIGKSDYHNNEK